DPVDLVATARAELGLPHRPGRRVDRQPGRVAVAGRPDLRLPARDRSERVVLRYAAVEVEAEDLADVVARVLHQFAVVAVAAGDVEVAVLVDRHASAVAAVRRALAAAALRNRRRAVPRLGDEDVLDLGQPVPAV